MNNNNQQWITDNKIYYPNKYIALKDGVLLAVASRMNELIRQLSVMGFDIEKHKVAIHYITDGNEDV